MRRLAHTQPMLATSKKRRLCKFWGYLCLSIAVRSTRSDHLAFLLESLPEMTNLLRMLGRYVCLGECIETMRAQVDVAVFSALVR